MIKTLLLFILFLLQTICRQTVFFLLKHKAVFGRRPARRFYILLCPNLFENKRTDHSKPAEAQNKKYFLYAEAFLPVVFGQNLGESIDRALL